MLLRAIHWSSGRSSLSLRCPAFRSFASLSSQPSAVRRLERVQDDLLKSLSNDQVTTNPYELQQHGTGESYHAVAPPDIVVYPKQVADIQHVVAVADTHRIPIIPFGAGTSVEGHIHAIHGGISLDMMKYMNSIEYDETIPNLVTVGAGVTRHALNDALRHSGYWFAVDPGADATLGGMMATSASGTTAVRYGTMKDTVVACQCVLADGQIVHIGTKAPKNAAGYNLLSLLTGSEGTLAIITQLTVKLRPIMPYKVSAVAVFDNLHDAASIAADLLAYEIPILRCELLDAASVQAFNDYSKQSRAVQPTLFLEFQSFSPICLQEQLSFTKDTICHNALEFSSGKDDPDLWKARHSLYYAAIASRPNASGAITTDACVPLSKFADVMADTVRDVQESQVVGPCFGHAGDGNLHCILPVCDDDHATGYFERLQAIQNRLAERAIAAGGTVSGEHGVGMGKMHYLERQYGKSTVEMMQTVKQSMDPKNILNPGKVVPR